MPQGSSTPEAGQKAGESLLLTSKAVVESFPGPALVVDAKGRLLTSNEKGRALATATLQEQRQGRYTPKLSRAIAAVAGGQGPTQLNVTLGVEASPRSFDLSLLPLAQPQGAVLLLAHEVTISRNLTSALVDSRQMFKDIVSCSADFAWETRADGSFSYISPRGALGYSAAELDGRKARSLMPEGDEVEKPFPFTERQTFEDQEVWLLRKDGERACLEVSSLPVFDSDGNWKGCRGLCKDVTVERAQAEALARAAERERLLDGIVDAIRNEPDPETMFHVAARGLEKALGAERVWIYRIEGRRRDGQGRIVMVTDAPEGRPDPIALARQALDVLGESDRPVEISQDGRTFLVSPARHGERTCGIVFLLRGPGEAWGEEDHSLAAGVGHHIGIAIAQVESRERLLALSRTDELTGLLNRRAFNEYMEKRLGHARRMRRKGALLYIDLDNFKPVNDRYGHQAGDEVLILIADLLRQGGRAGDFASRLGGDEFALWLDETDEAGAVAKAEKLLKGGREIVPDSVGPDHDLGFSIGIAVYDGGDREAPFGEGRASEDEDMDGLVTRADTAMYEVKHAGKGGYRLAPPAVMGDEYA